MKKYFPLIIINASLIALYDLYLLVWNVAIGIYGLAIDYSTYRLATFASGFFEFLLFAAIAFMAVLVLKKKLFIIPVFAFLIVYLGSTLSKFIIYLTDINYERSASMLIPNVFFLTISSVLSIVVFCLIKPFSKKNDN